MTDYRRILAEPNLGFPNRKPVNAVRIARSNKLTRGLLFAFTHRYRNGQRLGGWSTPIDARFQDTGRFGQQGINAQAGTALEFRKEPDVPTAAASDDFSWIVHCATQSDASSSGALFGNGARVCLGWNGTNDTFTLNARYSGEGPVTEKLATSAISFDRDYIVILSHKTGTRQTLWLNGKLEDSATETANIVANMIDMGLILPYRHNVRSAFYFNRALSDGECRALSRDLYQLVEPIGYSGMPAIVPAAGQTINLGQATESDSALSITPVKTINQALGQATEADSALSITPAQAQLIALGQATEADSALSIVPLKTINVALGQALESDSALSLTPYKAIQQALGQSSETDSALSITPIKDILVSLGPAQETDSALNISPPGVTNVALGQSTETDSALSISPVKSILVDLGIATETDTALGLVPLKAVDIGTASEADSALSISVVADIVVELGIATETDTALSIFFESPEIGAILQGYASTTLVSEIRETTLEAGIRTTVLESASMSIATVVSGDDLALVINLLSDGAAFNMAGKAAKARVVTKDRLTTLTDEITQDEAAPNADWSISKVAVEMTAAETASIDEQGSGWIEIQVEFPEKKSWFEPVQIVRGNIA